MKNTEVNNEDVTIANGGYGNVYTTNHKEHGRIVVKRLSLSNATDNKKTRTINDVKRENKIMDLCEHPHILKCYGDITWSTGSIGLLLENAKGGNLQDLILRGCEFSWEDRLRIGMEIADSLRYLHSKPIAHCDLKSQNVLLTEFKEVQLADFGAAKMLAKFSDSCESLNAKQKDQKTDLYCPPEEIPAIDEENRVYLYCARDVYSYSMVLFEIVTRTEIYKNSAVPFSTLPTLIANGARPDTQLVKDVMKKLQSGSKDFHICSILWETMQQCWVADPLKRPTMEEVFQNLAALWKDIHSEVKVAENLNVFSIETELETEQETNCANPKKKKLKKIMKM